MKKTCMNCKHYHGCLAEEEGSSRYHIHNYCDKFNMVLKKIFETPINSFLDKNYLTIFHGLIDRKPTYDDLETGEACCWMFEEAEKPFWPDDEFDSNLESNKKLAAALLKYIFDKQIVFSYYEELEKTPIDAMYSDEELEKLKELLSKLKGN